MATDELERGRLSFDRRAWTDACEHLTAAERASALGAEDLERLAIAAYMLGREDESVDAWTRAHQEHLRLGDPARAARCALWLACELVFRGEMAPAFGWVARAGRVLENAPEDCAERGWLLTITSLPVMFGGDPAGAMESFERGAEIGDRFGDRETSTFARLGRGQALMMLGDTASGMKLLDEVMVAVTASEVSPILCGIAYCAVIDACQRTFDVRRAREWTAALSRWCEEQPDRVPFRGNCLVHRCEIFQLQGAWRSAVDEAQRACEWLAGPQTWAVLGSAHYQLAQIRRLRGEFAEAEESYRQASQAGRPPEPGMSLLRLAQGRVDAASASISRVLDEAGDPSERSRILWAFVEIKLAANDVAAARSAADELTGIAAILDAPFLHAVAAATTGAVLLAEDEARAALTSLRNAEAAWRELDAPHEAARVRVLIGLACRLLGDEATAELELDAARRTFEELGAAPDVERVQVLVGTAIPKRPGGLTARELEVLALVASGMTNKAVATELVLSEKTVARHVSNIFTKLGISSRSAATAYAYEHGLVERST